MAAKRKKYVSVGSVTFRARLSAWKATAEMARRLGKTSDLVSRWSTGDRQPTPPDRALLEDKLGIPWRSWDSLLSASQAKTLAHELGASAEPTPTFQADSGPANGGAGHAA